MFIAITEENNKVTLSMSEDLHWTDACLLLCTALKSLAFRTKDAIIKTLAAKDPKATKAHLKALSDEVSGDIADTINFAVSNILNELSPKDPDLQLSEIAIATMENEIIHYAADHHISIKKALKEYEDKLKESKYAATTSRKLS